MLKDIYFAERQILKNLPKMAKAAHSEDLKKAFLAHHDETEGQIERLQQVFEIFGKRALFTLPNIARNKSPGTSGSRRSDDFTPRLHGRRPEGSVRSC